MSTGTVSVKSALNLRSEPDDTTRDNIIGQLRNGASVEILSEQGEWLEVRADGREGFVASKFVRRNADVDPPSPDASTSAAASSSPAAASSSPAAAPAGGESDAQPSAPTQPPAPAQPAAPPPPPPAPPRIGVVQPAKLNLRSTPDKSSNANVVGSLSKGQSVQILGTQGDWLRVSAQGRVGFVAAEFISEVASPPAGQAGASPGQPSAPAVHTGAAGSARYVGSHAVGPEGEQFGKRFKLGVFNYGQTSISDFVRANAAQFEGVSPSRLRIMQAVSANEGKLEAINTWDNAFLTFGIFQWTVGAGTGPGELAAMLARLKRKSPDAFQQYFGQYGLDVSIPNAAPNTLPVGYFVLNGTELRTPAQKERMRNLDWAYRFWLSGHDPLVRQAQVEHAMERVDLFYRCPRCLIGSRFVGDYVSSECGVALILDQHVNRPGHVPKT
ncbi:MAG TPA: SH3 domain-containing protein, partial [Pyrinomonadaceae bacterium]|nr:SH3 domain-containing protein [Pyrinomonadaceae bacterium]